MGAYVERNVDDASDAKKGQKDDNVDTIIAFLPKDMSPDELTVEKRQLHF